LLAFNQDHSALDVARDCLTIDPTFTLDKAEDVTRLATASAAAGRSQLALQLLTGFHKRFRNHADIARNYLLAAKIMAERLNKEMQARALLEQIKIVLPEDPLIPEVDAYIAFLDKLATTPTKPPSELPSAGAEGARRRRPRPPSSPPTAIGGSGWSLIICGASCARKSCGR